MRLVVALLFALGCHAAERDEKLPPSALELALRDAQVPGISVAIVRDGRVVSTSFAGFAKAGDPVREDTAFEAASVGKPIIAIGVLQLAEAHRLLLDGDVSEAVGFRVRNPAFPDKPISLRELLGHRSSVHDRALDLEAAVSDGDPSPNLAEYLPAYLRSANSFSEAAPGTHVEYSNVGFALAALAIERASGQAFDAYARDHVLVPAGATAAAYRRSQQSAPLATPHHGSSPLASKAHAVYPVVDLRASARELALVLAALLRGELLTPERATEMFAEKLGWQTMAIRGRELVGHEGEDEGASTMMFFDEKTHVGAVVLTNGDAFASNDAQRAKALEKLLDALTSPRMRIN